jgi:hypothetical protein
VVEAGVEVQFTQNTGLAFKGFLPCTLHVEGTQSNPVQFRGWNGGPWTGLYKQDAPSFNLDFRWIEFVDANTALYLDGITNFFGNPNLMTFKNCSMSGLQAGDGIVVSDAYTDGIVTTIHIEDCTATGLTGKAFYVQTNDPSTVRSCSTSGCNIGFMLINAIQAENLSVSQCPWGIRLIPDSSSPLVLSNSSVIGSDEEGIMAEGPSNGLLSITHCTIMNGNRGIKLLCPGVVNNCIIHDNASFDAYIQTPIVPVTTINMRNNYWGPTTTAEMQAEGTFSNIEKIYDWWDDSSRSLVDYEGFIVPTSVPEGDVKPASWADIKSLYR